MTELTQKEDAKLELIRRTNRRKQAWLALLTMIAVTFCLMFAVPESKIKLLEEIMWAFYITTGGIVATYHGASAWMTKK